MLFNHLSYAAELEIEHPGPEGQCAGARLELKMDQGHQVGDVGAGWRRIRPHFQTGDQVELPPFPLWRSQGQLLIQPVDFEELESFRPDGEEAKEEGAEELLDQDLKPLVVIRCIDPRHHRLPLAPGSQRPTKEQQANRSGPT